jgi:hypothetical protein
MAIHKNFLMVEGRQDRFVIPELIEANGVNWGNRQKPVVFIQEYDGYLKLVDPLEISTALKGSGLEALGIMVDADEHPDQRWQSLRNACLKSIPDLPNGLPETGLIHNMQDGKRFGIWMMPDNRLRGMLETFLAYMVPGANDALWTYSQTVVEEAHCKNAPFSEFHRDKAQIYTWLAWQDPPGRQLHQAVMERILDPNHPRAQVFISWFKQLYKL